jgi:ankyrin repeat protein
MGKVFSALLVVFALLSRAGAQMRDPETMERQRRAMLDAAERGDVSSIHRIVSAGGTVEVADDLGRTPLLLAVAADRLDAVKVLLAEGADINAQALNQDTPWLLAGALGRTEMLRLMIPRRPDLSKRNRFGGTALIPACHYGHVDTVRLLLTTSIDVDHVNDLGWTCLLEAVILGDGGPRHQEIVRLVLAAGANPKLPDKHGTTALTHARAKGYSRMAAILEGQGAR